MVTSIIPTGSVWKYLDNGSNLGTAWYDPLFNDSGWASGAGQLGYGDGDETTVLSYGGFFNTLSKYPTTYFRKSFQIADPASFDWLNLKLLRDDGAVVYVNGKEVFRSNLPDGKIDYNTRASSRINGGAENTFSQNIAIDPSVLVPGNNVIAVEIHQYNGSSSDISFDLELSGGNFSNATTIAPQYQVKQTPRLQLGDAPLVGFPGSETDQVEILWQTVAGGNGTQDSFVVEYRPVSATGTNPWISLPSAQQFDTATEGRIVHGVEIDGLAYNSDYEYRVRHLRGTQVVNTYQSTFTTRKPVGDNTPFTFAAYGDSAHIPNLQNFRQVQNQINLANPDFALILGDNAYNDGTHQELDARFDPTLNPEATQWIASKIDYMAIGNHDIYTQNGLPSRQNYSVPIHEAGVDSPFAPPTSEPREHNYSFDYGNVHFATFDTNSFWNNSRLDAQLDWIERDLAASNAPWKIVFAHHPVDGTEDKEFERLLGPNYYDKVISRLNKVGVDLFLVGHSHTYGWTYPLTGQAKVEPTYVLDPDKDYAKGAGVVQVVSGVGGKSLRDGSYNQYPFVAAGFSSTTPVPSEDGFSLVSVTPDRLTIDYVAADNGAVIDSFSITDNNPLASPITNTFQQGLNGYTGTVDTYLRQASPDSNNANAATLNADTFDGNPAGAVQTLMRFEDIFGIGSGQIPYNAAIVSASLQLQVSNPGDRITLNRMLQSWADTDTWNSLTNGIQTNNIEAASISDRSTTGRVANGLLSVDVTQSLETWQVNPQTNNGWAILGTGIDGVDFGSAENTAPPSLKVVSEVNTIDGSKSNESLTGSAYNDLIKGLAGNDSIIGDRGDDLLVGGAGVDSLTGGLGADLFLFDSVSDGIDRISDFNATEGDKILIEASSFGATAATQFNFDPTTGAISFGTQQFATLEAIANFNAIDNIILV